MLFFLKACSANFTSLGLSSTSKISTASGMMAPSLEGEVEGGALIGLGVGPDASAVALDDALHDGQADSGPLVLLGPVQPLEDAEQLVGVAHVEADPVVP